MRAVAALWCCVVRVHCSGPSHRQAFICCRGWPYRWPKASGPMPYFYAINFNHQGVVLETIAIKRPPGYCKEATAMNNPRYANGALRRKHRARLRAMGCECGICKGRLGPIHYDEPSDAEHPLSFVVDEIRPVSRWREFGYSSPRQAAEDWNNLQAAHYWCNAQKSNKVHFAPKTVQKAPKIMDGNW